MKLAEMLRGVHLLSTHGDMDVEVGRAHGDSRKIGAGDVYVALMDVYRDGMKYVRGAVEAGAAALVLPRAPEEELTIPWVTTADPAAALARACAAVYGNPSHSLELVGVTGTNGKTTTCHLLEAILMCSSRKPALLGTAVGARYSGKTVATGLTTPEAPELQAVLADMVQNEVTTVAMEVSSHGIALRRVEGCRFAVGVLTGIGSDHLDFHESQEVYAETKVNWLLGEVQDGPQSKGVVVPADDEYGMEVYAESRKDVLTYGFDDDADIFPDALELTPAGTRGRIATPEGTLTLNLALPGRHNVRNAMAATGAALLLGVEPIAIVDGLARVRGVPGRFESVPNDSGISVIVDYAHTPDALQSAIEALRELCQGRLIVVFGCGGDRDRSKRPVMGRVVAEHADAMVVTSDNPRSEGPGNIIDEILLGLPVQVMAEVHVEPDRREAIRQALTQLAQPGDCVLIAGKGHETGQTIGDETLPFDDREVAAEVLTA